MLWVVVARCGSFRVLATTDCDLSAAKGGFVAKLWPEKVINYKYLFLQPQSCEKFSFNGK